MQRFVDIVFSGLAVLVLLPVLLPIMLALRLTGEGEIFFRQQRIGKDGEPFGLLKFATMLKDSPNMGTGTVTVKDDPRILPVGRFLRKTKINELPQLFNILKGDMSIVGPRPQERRCFDAFAPEVQMQLIRVRPGLSGIGSIVFRDEESILGLVDDPVRFYDDVIAPYKGAVERWYIDHQTLRNYFLVIAVTAWVVLFPRSPIVWRVFDLPAPPPELERNLMAASTAG
ncbi:Lipid carrier : UDP-N-acetylgalactosaminyltransferase [Thioalkalivibrio nitratireducens DSM 14787]|uniref:Lipid carrier: UDP-N-acetylgalactosaminyltransferase n=1 Tax=Thioalkalivibrio nitratireducens (strain DSM 14787 / UNIQEM 213 / ALEN2) TaxID=1255043 RepID=L0DS93_THIND|nr:sugar transferase [Thioalkalivibrio nitratireducens]AGA32469.1 Lipid carrier : UDP-N-acetylgalactosaminyltransferase [Thioalkalivibrio nitratireducens DSM 14787]